MARCFLMSMLGKTHSKYHWSVLQKWSICKYLQAKKGFSMAEKLQHQPEDHHCCELLIIYNNYHSG